jgi:hypothetical protein
MHRTIRLITLASSLLFSTMPASAADDDTVTVISDDSKTNSLTLAKGESAKLVFSRAGVAIAGTNPIFGASQGGVMFLVSLGELSYKVTPDLREQMVIAGPAVVTLMERGTSDNAYYRNIATFEVKKIGTASPPAEVPQEAGSNFDVVLEQSSDLVNWTPANPGAYSGTETKRFFRTRIVKKQ